MYGQGTLNTGMLFLKILVNTFSAAALRCSAKRCCPTRPKTAVYTTSRVREKAFVNTITARVITVNVFRG